MTLILRLLAFVAMGIMVVSSLMAANLYWNFNFGACKDGCPEGMAYSLMLPSIIVAVISAVLAFVFHRMAKRRSVT